ncbi:MAG: Maf family protein [Pseudomonadota bacterium]
MILPITLASGSSSRRALLQNAGVRADATKPGVDEDQLKEVMRSEGLDVAEQAMRLADAKALNVSQSTSGLVIGGDQMLGLGSRAFDKPNGMEGVRQHLRDLSGKCHILETAIAVAEDGKIVWRHLERPSLTVRTLSDEFIDHYLAVVDQDVCNTVGGYKLEGIGIQLFSKIEGDYFSILGLPLIPLLDYLRDRQVIPR